MASALVHLGADQIQHVEQPPTLIMMGNVKGDMLPKLVTGTFGLVGLCDVFGAMATCVHVYLVVSIFLLLFSMFILLCCCLMVGCWRGYLG